MLMVKICLTHAWSSSGGGGGGGSSNSGNGSIVVAIITSCFTVLIPKII